nr:translation initiation factor IF-2 [Pseudomonadota bacterium]
QKPQVGRKAKSTQITTAAEHKRVVKMDEAIVIAELARQMGLKATDVLKKIWELGMRSVMINSPIDFDTAQLVATEFDWRVESTAFQEQSVVSDVADNAEDLLPRAPVITIMGHVDHGKTSLLDAIRNANVAAGEAGGITQHIGAYKVSSTQGDVVFLDTPGHEAFTEMRARGAQVTDIVVLVVAADDGVMPQTVEALNHAKDAEVPIIVAVNKIDKPGAQPDRIRQQLSAHGLQPEEWGGDTIYVDVSARTKLGIDKLLEMLALQSDVMELKANPNKAARGSVVEARMDAKRGSVATVLVQEGTLKSGDIVCVGEEMGKVRAMMDDKGRQLTTAGPSTPVEVLGLSGVPRAGEVLNVVTDERAAKELVEFRRTRRIDKERAKAGPVSLDKLMDAMKAGLKELKVILKSDVQGSAEALSSALQKLSTSQVKVTVIQSGVGGITETDVNLAKAGNAIIIGFHVRPAGKANSLAEQEGVDIKLYDIIYDALDDVKRAMAGLLAPVKRDKQLGKAEVRELFSIPKIGVVLGCHVTEGVIKRAALIRLVRDSVLVHTGKLGSLRRFKDDVREVLQGYECGLTIDGYLDVKLGDVIECFEIEETAATLS